MSDIHELTDKFAGELLANRLNLSPYIGLGYENYPAVWCYRNFTLIDRTYPPCSFQDSEGKWVLYFSAVSVTGLVRAFKGFVHDEYPSNAHFINEPLHPPFLNEGEIVRSIVGAGTYYVVLDLTDDTQDQNRTRIVVVKTKSSNPMDWTDYVDVTRYHTEGATFAYDHKSKNILHLFHQNDKTEAWFSILNPTAQAQLMTPRKLLDTDTDLDYNDPINGYQYWNSPGQVDGETMWVTYDRMNEELVAGFRISFPMLDTVSGEVVILLRNIVINRSLTEAEMAVGQSALANNIPPGQGDNYNLFIDTPWPEGVMDDGVRIMSATFNEYYGGKIILAIHEMDGHAGQTSVTIGDGSSFRGTDIDTESYWFEIPRADMPSGFSGMATKAVVPVDSMLIPVGRPTGGVISSVPGKIARIEAGNRIRFAGGRSALDNIDQVGNAIFQSHRVTVVKTGAAAQTFFYDDDGTIYRLWEEAGEVKRIEVGLTVPMIPSGHVLYYKGWTFDGNLTDPTYFFLVTNNDWIGAPEQNEAIIISYNSSYPDTGMGEGWKEYTTKLDPEGVAESRAGQDSLYPTSAQMAGSFAGTIGLYTEDDHVVFSTTWVKSPDHAEYSSTNPAVSVFDPATDSLVTSMRVPSGFGPQTQGWHEDFGYYVTDAITPTGVKIRAQGAASYSDFWSGVASTEFFIPLDYANYNLVEVDQMYILLGGRFSETDSFTSALPFSQVSYIYMERSREAPYDIDFLIESTLMPNTWSRVLIAKIECDDIGPISQETYQVNWRT